MTNEALRITVSAATNFDAALKLAKHRAEEEGQDVIFDWEGFQIKINTQSDLTKVEADLADAHRLAKVGIDPGDLGPVFPRPLTERQLLGLAFVLAEEEDKQTETEALMGLQFC